MTAEIVFQSSLAGLGPAICTGIIEEHGSRIWARSKGRGCGTTVASVPALGADDYLGTPISISVLTEMVGHLFAEAEQAAARLLAARPAAGEHAERIRPRILIVEDHPINLELMMELLERAGYELYSCKDGRDVMPKAKAHRPDLILLDINLPHIDGLTLARMLREDPETRSVAIVAVSAYSVVGDEDRIRRAGCDGFIAKPIDTKSFLSTISTYLNHGTAR